MKDKIYFSNLNGLRFIAALMVIISHLELNKSYLGLAHHFHEIKHLGKLGVSLFFVLSGFLITFLLLSEKEKTATIGYRNFYMRRILRIWPLYYLIIILSLFILPLFDVFHIHTMEVNLSNPFQYLKVILLFVFFLPNLLIQIKLIPFATQTWSIGTEEQFYLVWPWIINNSKKYKITFLFLILAYNLVLYVIELDFFKNIPYFGVIKGTINILHLDVLTVGALAAYFLYVKHRILKYFALIPVFIILIISITVLIYFDVKIPFGNSLLYAIHFGAIILSLVHNPNLRNLLENKIFNYLGKISYGLYMYHQILIVFTINVLLKFNITDNFLIYFLSIILTIVVSGFSYRYIETPFLNKKRKYSIFNNEK